MADPVRQFFLRRWMGATRGLRWERQLAVEGMRPCEARCLLDRGVSALEGDSGVPGITGTPNNLVRFRRAKSAPPLVPRARKGRVFLDGKVSGTRDGDDHRWETTDVYGVGSRTRGRVARAAESPRDRLFKRLAFPRLNQIVPKDYSPNRRGVRLLSRNSDQRGASVVSPAKQRQQSSVPETRTVVKENR